MVAAAMCDHFARHQRLILFPDASLLAELAELSVGSVVNVGNTVCSFNATREFLVFGAQRSQQTMTGKLIYTKH